jgi:hypothetical protein
LDYIADELKTRAAAVLLEKQLEYTLQVGDYIKSQIYGDASDIPGINLLAMHVVRRCLVDIVQDLNVPSGTFAAQRTYWYDDAVAYRHDRQRARQHAAHAH